MRLRVAANLVLSVALLGAAAYLTIEGQLFWPDRNDAAVGYLFTGLSLAFLVASLVCFAVFALAVARGWYLGSVPPPAPGPIPLSRDPVVKGQIISGFWYLFVPAIVCAVLAFLLARRGPEPTPLPPPTSEPTEST